MINQEDEWARILAAIKTAFIRTKQLGANSVHKINQERCKQIEQAILETVEKHIENQ